MAKLDETGLEVATCRHVTAQKALNMFRGEVFGYPYFLIKNFMVPRRTSFCFADVMCKLWPFMRRDDPSMNDQIKPALSIMHAKGHALECQVVWSGEWLDGTGRSTGEETEQLFSYLSRFGNSTKYQLPEKREETLTEVVLHWNKTKIKKIVPDLVKRYHKNEDNLKQLVDLQDTKTHEKTIQHWKDEIQKEALGLKSRVVRQPSTAEKVLLLVENLHLPLNYHEVVSKLTFPKMIDYGKVYRMLQFDKKDKMMELDRLVKEVTPSEVLMAHRTISEDIFKPLMERAIEKSKIEKTVISAQVGGAADSSKRRRTIRTKLAAVKKSENKMFLEYLELLGEENNKQKYLLLDQGVLPWLNDSSQSEAIKRRIIVERHVKKNRYIEEKGILVQEMKNVLNFLHEKVTRLMHEYREETTVPEANSEPESTSANTELQSPTTKPRYNLDILEIRAKQGIKCLKQQAAEYFRQEFELGLKTFLPILDPDNERLLDFAPINENEDDNFDKDIDCEVDELEDDCEVDELEDDCEVDELDDGDSDEAEEG
ncbi:uncharacterized protein [Clytia hemisphaerica]